MKPITYISVKSFIFFRASVFKIKTTLRLIYLQSEKPRFDCTKTEKGKQTLSFKHTNQRDNKYNIQF